MQSLSQVCDPHCANSRSSSASHSGLGFAKCTGIVLFCVSCHEAWPQEIDAPSLLTPPTPFEGCYSLFCATECFKVRGVGVMSSADDLAVLFTDCVKITILMVLSLQHKPCALDVNKWPAEEVDFVL